MLLQLLGFTVNTLSFTQTPIWSIILALRIKDHTNEQDSLTEHNKFILQ